MPIQLIKTISGIKNAVRKLKQEQQEGQERRPVITGLVPTMGALHAGHESLIKKSASMCGKTVVSIFVNPIQFGPNEDYDKYPRTLEKDLETCDRAGADIVFAPSVSEMYGENTALSNTNTTFVCPPYNIVDCMCGKARPGHFDGAATVVLKLFNIVQPDYAFFGRKDAQQLFIINKMVKDFNMDVKIVPCPVVRDTDGLALSSRNTYLTAEERKNALTINKALKKIEELDAAGIHEVKKLFDAALAVLDKNIELEYLEFRNFDTFEPVNKTGENTLAAIAAKSGAVRLIDNIIIKERQERQNYGIQ